MFTVALTCFELMHAHIERAVHVFCEHFTRMKHASAWKKLSEKFFFWGGGGEVGKEKGPWRGCQIGRVLKMVKMSKKLCSLLKAYVTNFCLVVPSDSSIYFRNEWKWQSTHFCRQESQVRFVGLSFHSHSSAICAVIPTSLKPLVCLTQYIVKFCELI